MNKEKIEFEGTIMDDLIPKRIHYVTWIKDKNGKVFSIQSPKEFHLKLVKKFFIEQKVKITIERIK